MPEAETRPIPSITADAATTPLVAQGQRAGADRGDPQVCSHAIHRDDRSGAVAGLWTCTPGSWPVPPRDNTEVAHILSGRARITDADGHEKLVGPGDVLVLPVGWAGRWEIIEEVRKVYVIVDALPPEPGS
ncbi:MAG: DUF861 domain-containing protein [Actinobacteria bacterium]|jgi:uncharacterized cupin superfamily protein|nr:DUF861 domain-containing protein [Actinomycetota bacterium]